MFRHNKIECLNEDEYEFLQEWFSKRRTTVNHEYKVRLYEIYNRIFNKNQKPSSCSSCVVSVILRLEKVFNEYR